MSTAIATFATLPMYDFPDAREATDAWWRGLARHLVASGVGTPFPALLREGDLIGQWQSPSLLISQTCGYLATHELRSHVTPVAVPHYAAPGCDGPNYASAILVPADHPGLDLADFRGSRAAYSRAYSHAGYNAFRSIVAPLADGQAFFASVLASDSHVASIAAIASGRADIATVDCVVHAFVARWQPAMLTGTRILGYTPTAPAPPYVAPINADAATIRRLQTALTAAMADDTLAECRDALFLAGFSAPIAGQYDVILDRAATAIASGYPVLR